jgi:hypothetical protein
MALDLKILIEGDPDDFIDAIDQVKKESEDLDNTLSTIGKGAGIAFAAFSGAILGSVIAFRDSEKTVAQLEATLNSTGYAAGLSSEAIKKMAVSFQDLTTFGDEAIISGQTVLLKFQQIKKDAFEPATRAALDMATALGTDVASAAETVGKSLNDPIQGLTLLKKQGILFTEEQKKLVEQLSKTGQVAEAQKIILDGLGKAYGGSAQAAANGLGSISQLKEVLGDIVEGVGKEFAPAFASAAKFLTEFAKKVRDSDTALSVIARILAAGAGMAGFITAVTFGALAVSKIVTALQILQIALGASRIAMVAFMGAATLGIGLILAFLPEIIQFAKDMVTAFQAAKENLTNLFKNLFQNIYNIIVSYLKVYASLFDWKKILTGDFSGIKDAAKALGDAVGKAVDDTFKDVREVKQSVKVKFDSDAANAAKEIAEKEAAEKAKLDAGARAQAEQEKQDAIAKRKAEAEEKRHTGILAQEEDLRREIIGLKKQGAADEVIRIKEEELKLLQALNSAKSATDIELAQLELDAFRQTEDARIQIAIEKAEEKKNAELEAKIRAAEEKRALDAEIQLLEDEDQLLLQEKNVANLDAQELQRRDALLSYAQSEAAAKKKANDAKLADEIKYGKTYAEINAALNSQVIQGTIQATGQLVQLQQSRNSTLKGIGKAAAVIQIGIDTAKSAMSIYAGFATIPIIGPALGVAGAAAAIAFGLEKANQVRSAQEGGVVPGSGSGDIIPAFLEPGEIVVPKALAPTFAEEFSGLSPDANSPARRSEVKINTIIGTEEFVRSNIIPAIRDATQLDNANVGVG